MGVRESWLKASLWFFFREMTRLYEGLIRESRKRWNRMVWKRLITTKCVRDLDKLNLIKLFCGGSVLGSSKFMLLPQLPKKLTLVSQVNKWGRVWGPRAGSLKSVTFILMVAYHFDIINSTFSVSTSSVPTIPIFLRRR